jgi:opacity protein-like surface antigen
MKLTKLVIILIIFCQQAMAQDLMDLLDDGPKTEYTTATFKASRIILGHSVENPPKGALVFEVSHHFGTINSGWYEFFGLDQANIRLGFDFGITDWLAVGIGRTSVQKVFDGYVKAKILRQSKGEKSMPITLTYLGAMGITSLKWADPDRENYFSSRMSYVHQLLIGRKFTRNLSLQLTPTLVHRNLVETKEDENDVWSIGAGGRYKLNSWISVNAEYYYLLPGQTADDFSNSFSIGVDLETGGHVFQLFLTNSRGLIEQQFIPQTSGKWGDGDIHIGFNIHRTFQIVRNRKPPSD